MADKKETTVTKKSHDKKAGEVALSTQSPPWGLIAIGTIASVVMVVVSGIGLFVLTKPQFDVIASSTPDNSSYRQRHRPPMFDQYGSEGTEKNQWQSRRGMVTASGVVTAISGDSLTISGHGKQTTIAADEATIIGGDKDTVAINDSVIIFGSTQSDGTVLATQIIIHNGSGMDLNMWQSDDNSDAAPSI